MIRTLKSSKGENVDEWDIEKCILKLRHKSKNSIYKPNFRPKQPKKRAIDDVEKFITKKRTKVDTFEQQELVLHGLLHGGEIGKQ